MIQMVFMPIISLTDYDTTTCTNLFTNSSDIPFESNIIIVFLSIYVIFMRVPIK